MHPAARCALLFRATSPFCRSNATVKSTLFTFLKGDAARELMPRTAVEEEEEAHTRSRPRRAFGKRPPAPGKNKRKTIILLLGSAGVLLFWCSVVWGFEPRSCHAFFFPLFSFFSLSFLFYFLSFSLSLSLFSLCSSLFSISFLSSHFSLSFSSGITGGLT